MFCNFQTQQRIRDDAIGSRFKRSTNDDDKLTKDWILNADRSQQEFIESSKKMGESLKNIENIISDTIVKRKQEHEVTARNENSRSGLANLFLVVGQILDINFLAGNLKCIHSN